MPFEGPPRYHPGGHDAARPPRARRSADPHQLAARPRRRGRGGRGLARRRRLLARARLEPRPGELDHRRPLARPRRRPAAAGPDVAPRRADPGVPLRLPPAVDQRPAPRTRRGARLHHRPATAHGARRRHERVRGPPVLLAGGHEPQPLADGLARRRPSAPGHRPRRRGPERRTGPGRRTGRASPSPRSRPSRSSCSAPRSHRNERGRERSRCATPSSSSSATPRRRERSPRSGCASPGSSTTSSPTT